MTAQDLLAEIPRPQHVTAFAELISKCPHTVYALSAMVLALEQIECPEAAELIQSIRAKMAEIDIAVM